MRHEDTYDLLSWDRDFFSACWWNLIFFTMLALKSSKPLETRINQLLWSSWWGNLTAGSSFPLQASAFLESESGSLSYELILIEFVHPTRNLTLVNFVCNIQITWTSAFYTKCRAWKSSEETHSEKKRWSGQDALSVAAPLTSLSSFAPAALNFNSHIKTANKSAN